MAQHTLIICPAVDVRQDFIVEDGKKTTKRADPPAEWVDEVDGHPTPRQIPILFRFGQAEVEDSIGRYLLARGLARPDRLIIPNNWSG